MLRFTTAGESHGPGLMAIVDGVPAGLRFSTAGLDHELARRRAGYGRGPRMRIEQDAVEIIGGVRHGVTTGAPVGVLIRNTEAPRWASELSAEEGTPLRPLSRPRPGHADLAGMMKFDTKDARDILERASARETAARAVAGYVARLLLHEIGVDVIGHVIAIGDVETPSRRLPAIEDAAVLDASPVRVLDSTAAAAMMEAIDDARKERDTLGGVVGVVAYGVPPGFGSYTRWERRLDGALARAVMSIPGVKGVEIGDAFSQSHRPGSTVHDEIDRGYGRSSNRAGGLEGGLSNGEPIVVHAAMKPLSTLMRPLRTVDVVTGEPASAMRERSDVCAVPAASVVAEHMVAFILAREATIVFGGSTIGDVVHAARAYRRRLEAF